MDLRTREWDDELLELFGVPRHDAPDHPPVLDRGGLRHDAARRAGRRRSSGRAAISAISRQPWSARSASRRAKPRTPTAPAISCCSTPAARSCRRRPGLLTTPCYSTASGGTVFALEGSIAVTGSAVQWLRDQIGVIRTAAEIETLAASVPDNGGVYFVPAFSGLFAPYWRSDARGAIVGLSRFNTSAHLARATLEAICFQTRDVLDAMTQDSGVHARRAQGRWRRDREQPADAAAGRHSGRAGRPAGRRRDDRARRRVRRRPGGRVLERHRRPAAATGRWIGSGSRRGRPIGGKRPIATGRGPSIAVWTGSSPLSRP